MEIEKYGKRTTLVTFNEINDFDTSVFIIECEKNVYIIDTFCGSKSMEKVKELIKDYASKRIIIINTHFHWDHIWGNCSFADEMIISSSLTHKLIEKNWDSEYSKNKKYIQGEAVKKLPNTTFEGKIFFENDGIEIFQSAGHTADSISIFDRVENTLFVGDNIERPIIYVEDENIEKYIDTLNNYKTYGNAKIFASHTIDIGTEDIENTIEYLIGLNKDKEFIFTDEYVQKVHRNNLEFLGKK